MSSPAAFAAASRHSLSPLATMAQPHKTLTLSAHSQYQEALTATRRCLCGRRHLFGASAAAALLPILPSNATGGVERFHPSRPDWYEEMYANAMEQGMRSYETEIADYKADLFNHLSGESKNVLELGVGTGPNFKYYATDSGLTVFGVDPNKQMEKYARAAAVTAGLPPERFNFVRGVGEALPVSDNSMDAVIGTLVLCSVEDVDMALKEVKRVLKPGGLYLFIEHVAAEDGSLLRFVQNVLDPLQQVVADGCHLTRQTGREISRAGFSSLNVNMAFVSGASIISPHVYGVACK